MDFFMPADGRGKVLLVTSSLFDPEADFHDGDVALIWPCDFQVALRESKAIRWRLARSPKNIYLWWERHTAAIDLVGGPEEDCVIRSFIFDAAEDPYCVVDGVPAFLSKDFKRLLCGLCFCVSSSVPWTMQLGAIRRVRQRLAEIMDVQDFLILIDEPRPAPLGLLTHIRLAGRYDRRAITALCT